MTNAFESIQQGLIEAIEFVESETKGATVHKVSPVDVKAVCGHDQAEFASTFGIIGTLRYRKRGD